jgi:hypothetical protein
MCRALKLVTSVKPFSTVLTNIIFVQQVVFREQAAASTSVEGRSLEEMQLDLRKRNPGESRGLL